MTPSAPSFLRGTGDPLDFARFDELLSAVATALGKLGDTDSFDVRRSKALGVIADQDKLIAVLTRAENLDDEEEPEPDQTEAGGTESDGEAAAAQPKAKGRRPRRSAALLLRKPAKTKFYAHFSTADLATMGAATGESVVIGQVDGLGPATMAMIREWLPTGATITAVIRPQPHRRRRRPRPTAVDA